MFIGTEAAFHLGSRALTLAGGVRPAVSAAGLGKHLATMMSLLGLGGVVSVSSYKVHVAERQLALEERLRRELSAYLTSDLCPGTMVRSEFGRRMSQIIATRSSFARAAVLLRDAAGALCVAGSAGVDDLSVRALNRWGAQVTGERASNHETVPLGERVGACSFALQMERRLLPAARDTGLMSCARVYVTPIRSATGVVGALVVCAEPRPSVRELSRGEPMARLVEPLEALALRLTLQLARSPGRALRETPPAPQAPVVPERTSEIAEEREEAGQEVHEMSVGQQEVRSLSIRQLIAITEAKGVLPMPKRSERVTGFPPARMWHSRPASGGLVGLTGGGAG